MFSNFTFHPCGKIAGYWLFMGKISQNDVRPGLGCFGVETNEKALQFAEKAEIK